LSRSQTSTLAGAADAAAKPKATMNACDLTT
jgi:hypothetical protein